MALSLAFQHLGLGLGHQKRQLRHLGATFAMQLAILLQHARLPCLEERVALGTEGKNRSKEMPATVP